MCLCVYLSTCLCVCVYASAEVMNGYVYASSFSGLVIPDNLSLCWTPRGICPAAVTEATAWLFILSIGGRHGQLRAVS